MPSGHRIDADGQSFRLPADYSEFLQAYGAGGFNEYVMTYSVENPNPYFDILEASREATVELEEFGELLDEPWPQFRLWPEPGSLVRWGEVAGEEGFYWLAEGEPDDWPIVVLRPTEQIDDRLTISTTEFILAQLEGPSPSQLLLSLAPRKLRFGRSPARPGDPFESPE